MDSVSGQLRSSKEKLECALDQGVGIICKASLVEGVGHEAPGQ